MTSLSANRLMSKKSSALLLVTTLLLSPPLLSQQYGIRGIEGQSPSNPADLTPATSAENESERNGGDSAVAPDYRSLDELWRETIGKSYSEETGFVFIVIRNQQLGIAEFARAEGTEYTYGLYEKTILARSMAGNASGRFLLHAYELIEERKGDPAKGEDYIYEARFIVTGSFIDPTGRRLNAAGVLTQTNKESSIAGEYAAMRFSPSLFGDDLDQLHREALEQLTP